MAGLREIDLIAVNLSVKPRTPTLPARYGRRIARIHQDVRAVSLSPSLAELLKAEAGSPALQLVRRYLDASYEAFEISITTHPADRFTFSMQMERGVVEKGPSSSKAGM